MKLLLTSLLLSFQLRQLFNCLTFDLILGLSCAIHLVHQVYVSFGLRFSKLLLSLGSMAVNAFTMISFLCSVIKWTFERVSWLHLVICGRYGTQFTLHVLNTLFSTSLHSFAQPHSPTTCTQIISITIHRPNMTTTSTRHGVKQLACVWHCLQSSVYLPI